MNKQLNVAVLGATPKPERYANQAVRLLMEHGFNVIPIHPKFEEIESLNVVHNLAEIAEPIHSLSLYVGPARLDPMIAQIVALKPGRVIFNPGTESAVVQSALDDAGIKWLEACTLVMLRTGVFLED